MSTVKVFTYKVQRCVQHITADDKDEEEEIPRKRPRYRSKKPSTYRYCNSALFCEISVLIPSPHLCIVFVRIHECVLLCVLCVHSCLISVYNLFMQWS